MSPARKSSGVQEAAAGSAALNTTVTARRFTGRAYRIPRENTDQANGQNLGPRSNAPFASQDHDLAALRCAPNIFVHLLF